MTDSSCPSPPSFLLRLVQLLTVTVVVQGWLLPPPTTPRRQPPTAFCRSAKKCDLQEFTRSDFVSISSIYFLGTLGGLTFQSEPATAADGDVAATSVTKRSLAGCSRDRQPVNCVATASIKQVDCYAPPWTFQTSGDEAMARLKGVIASDPSLELLDQDDRYLKVRAARGLVYDQVEFLVSDADRVVTFRSAEEGEEASVPDFGANRKRIESIRSRAGVFGVMGDGRTADSYRGDRGMGPVGQLKSFYGLQSGKGFEDVFGD